MKNFSKNIYFLMSFGHCGIDWVHNLLNCHKQIIIIPEFSFFRIWNLYQLDKLQDKKKIFNFWINFFEKDFLLSGQDTKKFQNQKQLKLFILELKKNFLKFGSKKKNILYCIHLAFTQVRKIKITNDTIFVVHEHVSFYYFDIKKTFPQSKLILIIRDPRASYAGNKLGLERKCKTFAKYNYFWNMSINEWFSSYQIYKKYNSKELFIIKYEDMLYDLDREMKKLSYWMKIKFNKILLKNTYINGKIATIDTNYKRNLLLANNKTFFNKKNLEKRWKKIITLNEINMIEFFFKDLFNKFNYNPITKKRNFFKNLSAIYFFFLIKKNKKKFNNKLIFSDLLSFLNLSNIVDKINMLIGRYYLVKYRSYREDLFYRNMK